MSISATIRSDLAAKAPFHHRLEQVVAWEGATAVRCEVAGAEHYGCAVRQVEVVGEAGVLCPTQGLALQADHLCQKVNYLMEPLRAVEVDRLAGTVLIRSAQPRRRGNEVQYYELLADSHWHAVLRRYKVADGQRRRLVTEFNLTPDQLEQLAEDLLVFTH